MFRIFVLIGFTYLFFHLHASGDISKYINMKYSYISESAIYIFILFTLISIYFYIKGDKHDHEHEHDCDHCGHNHAAEENRWWKRAIAFLIMIAPVLTGLFLPVATLDSNIVEKKGLSFPVYAEGDEYSQHQFLQPDTSSYYGKEGYSEMMDKGLKKLSKVDSIKLEGDTFLNDLETIYNYPGQFIGEEITLTGFAYKDKELAANQAFLLRFGIIHCIADSGVYGILLDLPDDLKASNDDWLQITGTLDNIYYQPFKKTIPVLKVTKWTKVTEPNDPYVYRQN
ncbi:MULTISPECIES: TIGR03943 family protein [Bacillaceae]|uniref:TIGR03943 family putative permease subunit n=1 Tax=Bacillaceae TaxID=186817 RepID=UPI001E378BC6|nr:MULTISPECIES: TIGR03943 family protein [Bacillaceae]MCE4047026.1 TIGR03943 family protein [Bacillus sp. Au-Bac7]MCM3030130.1 TIGR03943 family protein [Niallia sp. MER 6]MDL0436579.1 TIGR03943 family protein [Niallia sp. SS-2023]UPO86590.1 TIGR03943 family protein [Niallia sp. Man26]